MINLLPTGQTEFRFFRRGVKSVCLVGTFNAWQIGSIPMQSRGDGWWQIRLSLPSGVHQFRYVADGQWYTDFAAHGIEHSKWGVNSLLVLGPVRAAA